jgi:two-component system nitrate/nitrite response regulator NarL
LSSARNVPAEAYRRDNRPVAHTAPAASQHPFRVVIIDDYADLRSLLKRFLERHGAFVVAASCGNARDGIDAARVEQPDLVLVDLNLPDINGIEAIGPLREAAPEARIVVLSSWAPETAAPEALRAGADAFVDKSSGGDDLPDMLLDIMGS